MLTAGPGEAMIATWIGVDLNEAVWLERLDDLGLGLFRHEAVLLGDVHEKRTFERRSLAEPAVDPYAVVGDGGVDVRSTCGEISKQPSEAKSDRADLARRIQEAREDAADAKDDMARSRAEQFLSQLTTLEGALLPA